MAQAIVASSTQEVAGIAPVIIDLGKEKKGRIKDLKRGRGRLLAEVAAVINEVRAGLGDDADSKQIVPVLLIYSKKRKGKKKGGGRGSIRGNFPFQFPFLF